MADDTGRVAYAQVDVETELPSDAIRLGRGALSEALDFLSRKYNLPLVLSRVDLVSPDADRLIAHELILPYVRAEMIVGLGGGGFHEPRWFAPYDALRREAITATSPYHRHLCACRIYEGVQWLRRQMRAAKKDFGVEAKLPKDPRVDVAKIVDLGVAPKYVEGVTTASDLFKRWEKHRHQIAHFFLSGSESHLYLSSGDAAREYSLVAAISLRYATKTIDDLRSYYQKHLTNHMLRGDVYPEIENRDQFVVRDKDQDDPQDAVAR